MSQQPDDLVEARIVETVQIWPPGEPADPFWRIEIDGFCADFDFQEAAENFAAAINRRTDAATITALRQRVAELEGERDSYKAALEEAKPQLEYLDEKHPTGTTPAVLACIDDALNRTALERRGSE